MVPETVRLRLLARTVSPPLESTKDFGVRDGDIRVARSNGEQRLVLVLKTVIERQMAQVALIHPYREWATSSDVVIESSLTTVAFPVVVETLMRGVVTITDLGELVTCLSAQVFAEVVATCMAPRMILPTMPGISTGVSCSGPFLAHQEFKNAERASLQRLCASCTATALEH